MGNVLKRLTSVFGSVLSWYKNYKNTLFLRLNVSFATSTKEVVFWCGNIISISVDEENPNAIVVLSCVGVYELGAVESKQLLRKYPRSTFEGAIDLLAIYDTE